MRGITARSWRAIKRFSARVPLRTKLITATLTLVAVALAVISTVSISVFHTYLLNQASKELQDYAQSKTVFHLGGFGPFGGFRQPPPGRIDVLELLSPQGRPVHDPQGQPMIQAPVSTSAADLPAIPASAQWISAHGGKLTDLGAQSGDRSWRVFLEPVQFSVAGSPPQGGVLLVGVDLGSISQTIRYLTLIDLLVGGVVILVLAGVGIALIRASLRPLAEIEQTAGAIAAGDLSRRVPDRDPRTEVGSLGRSLNLMLGQIEQAFRARSASEATARQSEERMRRFVADASHELRTPLSVIRGFAEYHRQRGGLKEDELDRMIKRVEDEAARMGLLVDDLLLLARLDQQRPLQRTPVDLLALAADAVQDARVLAPRRAIQLKVGSGSPFLVLGDEARLRQIISNLMTNALTHTPDGTPVEVRLSSGSLAADGGFHGPGEPSAPDSATPAAVLEVADQGPGLPPDQAERVFERFYRADAARTRKTGGTGLGLAIVAALAAAHGGIASVSSAKGQGATFRVTLPLAPDAADIQLTPDADTDELAPAGGQRASADPPSAAAPNGSLPPSAPVSPPDSVRFGG